MKTPSWSWLWSIRIHNPRSTILVTVEGDTQVDYILFGLHLQYSFVLSPQHVSQNNVLHVSQDWVLKICLYTWYSCPLQVDLMSWVVLLEFRYLDLQRTMFCLDSDRMSCICSPPFDCDFRRSSTPCCNWHGCCCVSFCWSSEVDFCVAGSFPCLSTSYLFRPAFLVSLNDRVCLCQEIWVYHLVSLFLSRIVFPTTVSDSHRFFTGENTGSGLTL